MTPSEIDASVEAYRARCLDPKAEVEYFGRDGNWKRLPIQTPYMLFYTLYRLKPAPKIVRRPLTQDEWARQRWIGNESGAVAITLIAPTIIQVSSGVTYGLDELCHPNYNHLKRTDGTIGPDGKLVWLPCWVEEQEGGAK